MKLFANRDIRQFFLAIIAVMLAFLFLSQMLLWRLYGELPLAVLLLFLMASCAILALCVWHFHRQDEIMERASAQICSYLEGDAGARIDCDKEGELYRLFHSVNALTAVLNAHAATEAREKEFLKNTISDISHQLKTPLAALNIYNGLLLNEAEELPSVREFVLLSEQELDRIDTLIQNLLKITRLDAEVISFEKSPENVADMMRDIELKFAYRAKQEQKELLLSGEDDAVLLCERDWMQEALGNIVKNALDHTGEGACVRIRWKRVTSMVQIVIQDNGSGIHPEDIHHIFKRFYRSRFSKDTQGIGLGLPIAKTVIEAHGGSIEVDSQPGLGTAFLINFLIPTKL